MKGLTDIKASNASIANTSDPVTVTVRAAEYSELLKALRTARASLDDVRANGASLRILANIVNVDLPIIDSALANAPRTL